MWLPSLTALGMTLMWTQFQYIKVRYVAGRLRPAASCTTV
nr:hypothetical protein JVH1_1923 [Rhodococcus sp. JVH1]